MKLDFDMENVKLTEFGVGRDYDETQTFVAVPVDADVQAALREIVQATWDVMQKEDGGPVRYEPSEKHGGTEYLYLPLNDDLSAAIRDLHQAVDLDMDSSALTDPSDVFCYFARLTDDNNRHLTALRRATQFKGVLKSRLVRFLTDSLKLVEDRIFKLDSDFDLLVDSVNVYILRPSGFEFAGKLQQAILDAVSANIKILQKDLVFVNFDGIEAYACKHPRAARYLASIRGQNKTSNIDKVKLKELCKRTGVEINESKNGLNVDAGHEMGFLEVLDRRRYELELVNGYPERFKAGSRSPITG